MKYNIEKINKIGKLLAEIVEEALAGERQKDVRIADVEMEVLESLREVGRGGSGRRLARYENCMLVRRRIGTQPLTFRSAKEKGTAGRNRISSQK